MKKVEILKKNNNTADRNKIPSKIFVANAIANNLQLEEPFYFWTGIIVTESFLSLSRSYL